MSNQFLDDTELNALCYELQLKHQNIKMQYLIAETIKRNGINRSILNICNSNNELDNFLGQTLSSAESLQFNQTLPRNTNQSVYNKFMAGLEAYIENVDVLWLMPLLHLLLVIVGFKKY